MFLLFFFISKLMFLIHCAAIVNSTSKLQLSEAKKNYVSGLSVCLSAGVLEKLQMDFEEILWRVWKKKVIGFWWLSGFVAGFWVQGYPGYFSIKNRAQSDNLQRISEFF